MRVLFLSPHCLIDPGSGAAVATLSLLRSLHEAGCECRGLCTGRLDLPRGTALEEVLAGACGDRISPVRVRLPGASGIRYDCTVGDEGERPAVVQVLKLSGGRGTPEEERLFLACLARCLREFRPDAVIAYGGDPVAVTAYRLLRARGRPVLFYLHNFAYRSRSFFDEVDRALVPSRWARDWYRRQIGIEPQVLPYVLRPDRCLCGERRPQYVTFVNPVPAKGVAIFARVAQLLARERPELRLLVVEARGRVDYLVRTGVDVRGLENVDFLPNVADPRLFLARSRLVLMPSLWNESFGLVAAEAMLNGIPVVASDRGALPETVGEGGIVVPVPRSIDAGRVEAVPAEVARPWVEAILRVYDDAALYDRLGEAARRRAAEWLPDRVVPRWLEYLRRVCRD